MSYKYVYKRGDEKNPVTDYHKKYITVRGKKVMNTRYTYEIALSRHWPDRTECTGPRGGKAVREFARYVWYADGMFYKVKRQLISENKFGNELVPLNGIIWDCHSKQTKTQGIPVVEITLRDGKPVSVLMDGQSIEVTDDTWAIAEELLYLNGARCPRSPNKNPSKPRKRRKKKVQVIERPMPKPIVRPEDEFLKTFVSTEEKESRQYSGSNDRYTVKTLYVAFSESPYKFWVDGSDATMFMTFDKKRFDKFVASNPNAMVCEHPNEVEYAGCYGKLALDFVGCGGKLSLYGYDSDRKRVVHHKLDRTTKDTELLTIIGRMYGSKPYLIYDEDESTGKYETPRNFLDKLDKRAAA